jgi:trehalose 6-phosphate phosphatase
VEPYVEAARSVLRDVAGLKVDGLIVEDKGPVVAFHYRNALNEWAARAGILDAIGHSAAAERFVIQEGRKVVELRPPLEVNKGTAVTDLAARLGVKSLICMGDDVTDLDMFAAGTRLRDGGIPAALVAVRSPEVAREVMDTADYAVDGGGGVECISALPSFFEWHCQRCVERIYSAFQVSRRDVQAVLFELFVGTGHLRY